MTVHRVLDSGEQDCLQLRVYGEGQDAGSAAAVRTMALQQQKSLRQVEDAVVVLDLLLLPGRWLLKSREVRSRLHFVVVFLLKKLEQRGEGRSASPA